MENSSFSPISSLPIELLQGILQEASDSDKPLTNISLVCQNWRNLVKSNSFLEAKLIDLRERHPTLISPDLSNSRNLNDVFNDALRRLKFLENPEDSLKKHPELNDDKYFLISALKDNKLHTSSIRLSEKLQNDEDVLSAIEVAKTTESSKLKPVEDWMWQFLSSDPLSRKEKENTLRSMGYNI